MFKSQEYCLTWNSHQLRKEALKFTLLFALIIIINQNKNSLSICFSSFHAFNLIFINLLLILFSIKCLNHRLKNSIFAAFVDKQMVIGRSPSFPPSPSCKHSKVRGVRIIFLKIMFSKLLSDKTL